jgi:hypothetical protein
LLASGEGAKREGDVGGSLKKIETGKMNRVSNERRRRKYLRGEEGKERACVDLEGLRRVT